MPTPFADHIKGQSRHQAQPTPRPSVRTLLVRLILICLLPATLLVGSLLFYKYNIDRTDMEQKTLQSARAAIQAVDEQLDQTEVIAHTLVTSTPLLNKDLAGFHQQLVKMMLQSNTDLSAALYDFDGQQLLNTVTPFGQPLPRIADLERLQSVFITGRMPRQIPVLHLPDGRLLVRTLAPVYDGKKVQYVLAVGVSIDRMKTLLYRLSTPLGAEASIIDSSGSIVASKREEGTLFDTKTHPEILKSKLSKVEGLLKITHWKGAPLIAAYSISPSSGWGVVIDIPQKTLDAPLLQSISLFGLTAVLILILSLSMAWLTGKRISKSVGTLRATAKALVTGTLTNIPTTYLRETDEVAQAMEASARVLTTRTQELVNANKTLQERTADLEARTHELQEAQHIAQTGHWKWDASSGAISVSDELHRRYGPKILLPFEEQRGTVYPEAAWQEFKAAAEKTLQTKANFTLLLPTLTERGNAIWTRFNVDAVCNSEGDVTGLRGTLQDVDVYVKAEMETMASEARLSLAMSSSDLALWDWNISSDELYFDERWASIPGYTVEEMPSNKEGYMRLIHPEDAAQVEANIEGHFKGKTRNFEVTYRIQHKAGHYLWVYGSGKVVERDAAGHPMRMLGVAYNINERKRQEVEIVQLQTELDATLVWQAAQHTVAALAHEINQPLASASILSEAAKRMLSTDGLSDEAKAEKTKQLEQVLESIANDIERAGETLKNLFKSLRKPDITQKATRLKSLLDESINTAREEGVFGYKIVQADNLDLPLVKVNSLQVTKVLLNLIHNAAQAMHAAQITDGKIWIRTSLSSDGSEVCVSVRDEGPGISAALQEEVFQPLITTKSNGMGMGLSISRALIEANGGKLWHSQENGQGATFHFTLPISS
jgi:PAS domain S-box-containing protein